MLNIFYMYGLMWIVILIMYAFGWSDLLISLDPRVLVFVLFTIVSSIGVGYLLRNKLKFYKLKNNPHKKRTFTYLLLIFFVIDIIYEGTIPLLAVLQGDSMYDVPFVGIPWLHMLATGISFVYCLYLVYIYICFKQKTVILEYFSILSFFVLLFQRQNIIMIVLLSMLLFISSIKFDLSWKSVGIVAGFIIAIMIVLFVFGVIGNVRYGIWGWNDSSMICEVAQINDKYPIFLPKQYVWAYIYLVSPLANLNYNVIMGNVAVNPSIFEIIYSYIPDFIMAFIAQVDIIGNDLMSPSLIVCTAFVTVFKYQGIIGMYLLYTYILGLTVIGVILCSKVKKLHITFVISLGYFFLFTFFTNPVVYPITAMMVIFAVVIYLLFKSSKIRKVLKLDYE